MRMRGRPYSKQVEVERSRRVAARARGATLAALDRMQRGEQRARTERGADDDDAVDVIGLRAVQRQAARSRSSASAATMRVRGSRAIAAQRARKLPARVGEIAAQAEIGERRAHSGGAVRIGRWRSPRSPFVAALAPAGSAGARASSDLSSGFSIASRGLGRALAKRSHQSARSGELAFELAAPAAKLAENPSRRGSADARAAGTAAGRSAARSAAAATRSP